MGPCFRSPILKGPSPTAVEARSLSTSGMPPMARRSIPCSCLTRSLSRPILIGSRAENFLDSEVAWPRRGAAVEASRMVQPVSAPELCGGRTAQAKVRVSFLLDSCFGLRDVQSTRTYLHQTISARAVISSAIPILGLVYLEEVLHLQPDNGTASLCSSN